jgi:O-antigen/teichoic acid export membrane protein
MGFGLAIARKIPELKIKKKYSSIKSLVSFFMGVQFLIGLLIFSFLFFLSDYIAINFFHDSSASLLIKVMSIEYIIGFPILKFILQGLGKVKMYSLIEPARITIIFSFLFFIGALNALFVGVGYLLAGIILNIFLFTYFLFLFKETKLKNPEKEHVEETVRFGIILFAGTLAGIIISCIDVLAITYFKGIEDVGLYQAAFPTAQFLWIFSSAISIVILPVISELWVLRKKKILDNTVSIVIKFLFIFLFPVAAILISFPDLTLSMLFGEAYIPAAGALQILAVGAIFYSVYSLLNITLIGIGKPSISTKIFVAMTFIALLLNLLLVPLFGIIGAAIATVISYVAGFCIAFLLLKRDIKIKVKFFDIVKIFGSGFVSIFLILLIKPGLILEPILEIIISLFIVYVSYTALLFLTKVIKKDDIKILSKINLPIPKAITNLLNRLVRE